MRVGFVPNISRFFCSIFCQAFQDSFSGKLANLIFSSHVLKSFEEAKFKPLSNKVSDVVTTFYGIAGKAFNGRACHQA